MKYVLLFLLALFIFIIAVTLGVQNSQIVSFNYLVSQGEYRLSSLLAVLFALGVVIGWLISGIFYLRLRWRLRGQQKKLRQLQAQKSQALAETAAPIDKG
ncbi:MAG: LapA family protein [Enterobacteriaceae bacterium]